MADLTIITAMCGIIFEHVDLESNITVLKCRGLKRGLDFLLFIMTIKLNLTTILHVFIPYWSYDKWQITSSFAPQPWVLFFFIFYLSLDSHCFLTMYCKSMKGSLMATTLMPFWRQALRTRRPIRPKLWVEERERLIKVALGKRCKTSTGSHNNYKNSHKSISISDCNIISLQTPLYPVVC